MANPFYEQYSSPFNQPATPLANPLTQGQGKDPYYEVRNDISSKVARSDRTLQEYIKYKQTLDSDRHNLKKTTIDDCVDTLNDLMANMRDAELDLNDLDSAVRTASSNPTHYMVSEQELILRRQFIKDSRQRIKFVTTELTNQYELLKQLHLFVTTKTEKSQLTPSSFHATTFSSGDNHAGPDDGLSILPGHLDSFVTVQLEKQKEIIKDQDKQLDDIHSGVKVLHKMSSEIGGELDSQNRLLSDLEAGVDNTNDRLTNANKMVKNLLAATQENCGCVSIFVLILILVIVLILVISLPSRN